MSKHILLIGVGGTGSHAVDLLYQKVAELGNQAGNKLTAIVFDTNVTDIKDITAATAIPLADNRSLGTVVESLDPKSLEDWFPCYRGEEAARMNKVDGTNYFNLEMYKGANQWRKKSYLAFVNLMANSEKRARFENAIEKLLRDGGSGALYEIYTVASLAGGTGSGSFIPITLYARNYMRKLGAEPRTHAMLACPDIYEASLSKDADQVNKVYANAYAILRELNAMNQVAFGYNKPQANGKQNAPIRFRLGTEGDPYTGLLFDADKEEFWKPSALPFNKIYLLDKLVGLSSVKAHDGVMANALYTLLCTDIGLAFDSTDNNLETERSAVDRRNAVYAGVAASELRYPLEDVVDYMAHKKAEEAAEGEWTTIFRDAEETVEDKRKAAAEVGKPFMLKNGEYAHDVELAAENAIKTPTNPSVPYILKRGLYNIVVKDDQPEEEEFLSGYLDNIRYLLRGQLDCDAAVALKAISSNDIVKKVGLFASSEDKDAEKTAFKNLVDRVYGDMEGYYINAVQTIRSRYKNLANAILPLGSDKEIDANKEYSLAYNLLAKNGKYIHPVAAFVQLCRLKTKLREQNAYFKEWEELRGFDEVYEIPEHLMLAREAKAAGAVGDENGKKGGEKISLRSSAYAADGEKRLINFKNMGDEDYRRKRSDAHADSAVLVEDAAVMREALFAEAENQLCGKVLTLVESRVDSLIEEYRTFFRRFEEGRKKLSLQTERSLKKNEGTEDITYIAATSQDKIDAYKEYKKNESFSADDLEVIDDIAGKSVFDTAYARANAALLETADAGADTDAETEGLFSRLVEVYRELIKKSSYYKEQSRKGIFQIMVENYSKGERGNDKVFAEVGAKLREIFDKAKPSLRARASKENAVMLFSDKAARYLYENAKDMDISSSDTDLKAYAEQFIQNAGIMGVDVAVAPKASLHSLSITRKVDNVQPISIDKINELGNDPKYFRMYQNAISNMHSQGTDMWNPHLGMELHKHGYLPYINPDYEKEYNEKLAKAVLYVIIDGKISYQPLPRSPQRAFWYFKDGKTKMLMHKGMPISEKNIHDLLSWLRMEDGLVETYSADYDRMVKEECQKLPLLISKSGMRELLSAITKNKLITKLRENLFESVNGVTKADKKLKMGLLDFAFTVKTGEEAARDCDDAEKLLKVGYETLKKFCEYRIADDDYENRFSVSQWQLQKFVTAFFNSDNTRAQSDPMDYTKAVFQWANENNCFMMADAEGNSIDADVSALILAEEADSKGAEPAAESPADPE